jgi:hypothetical protein
MSSRSPKGVVVTQLPSGSRAPAGPSVTSTDVAPQLEQYRADLTGYCYRMLGSVFEAEDAVQETFLRAWRAFEQFEGRAALRSWLYRIATNVCLDVLNGRQRRARPMDLGPASSANTPLPVPLGKRAWIEPLPRHRVLPDARHPADSPRHPMGIPLMHHVRILVSWSRPRSLRGRPAKSAAGSGTRTHRPD